MNTLNIYFHEERKNIYLNIPLIKSYVFAGFKIKILPSVDKD